MYCLLEASFVLCSFSVLMVVKTFVASPLSVPPKCPANFQETDAVTIINLTLN